MSEPLSSAARERAAPRVVDLVFDVPRPERRERAWLACALALAVHASLLLTVHSTERSLEGWSADLAAQVHAELSREELVELPAPLPPPPPAVETPAPAPAVPAHLRSAQARAPKQQPAAPRVPQPAAQAASVVTREPSSEEPVDLTADAFVTGRAEAYAGGVSSGLGTSKRAVPALPTAAAPSPAPARGLNLSQPVTLEAERWNCPWPKEADAEDIAEQTAVLRVWVRADGTVESVQTLSDPGHGFGAAALTCAEHTRFNPARDRSGRPVRAQSPPIRVRFTR